MSDDTLLAELAGALMNVHRIVSEASVTGFNWKDGDWAERLFASQWDTSQALSRYEERKREAIRKGVGL